MKTIVEFHLPKKLREKTKKDLNNHFDKNACDLIENGLFDFTDQYCIGNNINSIDMSKAIYLDSLEKILYTCNENKQTIQKIKKLISQNKYNAYNIAFLRPEELDIDNWIKIITKKKTTEEKLNNLPTIKWYPCKTCKNTKYFYHQLQTRSADEPMTTFYECKECNRNYKVNN